ncbi:hemin uptake protein HemP [Roseovarius indicus]|uniref:Hemin uptake protein n=1 Tax=Roseovarius indicus TaxID=540747 RepID=A0A0T5P5N1_9RHOB|nr:hemin uptake protein HemP [Roseovarius indicus]KRS16421.1 hypothetical protein XM52_19055 [Roseovarius indicus]OAO00090.1 hypothetical protein A8B76_15095 [Roseovarius indicus]QEW28399.1 Hemin uptake protein [Roseovarius indicus]SFE11406.1 Hemin uptake protein HemP [Roseovarius indicus]
MSVVFPGLPKDARAVPQGAGDVSETETPAYFANDLTQDGKLAFICHQDQIYTLRITRAGKLILTK